MKKLIAILLLGVSSAAWSSTVTINFESVAPGDLGPPDIEGDRYLETDGYGFYVNGGLSDTGTNQALTGLQPDGVFAPPAHVAFGQIGGGAFSLHDVDILACSNTCEIWGAIAGGGSISTLNVTDLGSGDWLNLIYVDIRNIGGLAFSGVTVDNVVVGAAVPVPAAVWLFGSALAGLGWLRRKQTG